MSGCRRVVVVGSGPNGLAAAVTMARAGCEVTVLERAEQPGGGARTESLGLADGVVHDLCSAVHPLACASPFFEWFDLRAYGVEFAVPEVSYGHPLPGGRSVVAFRDLEATCAALGADGPAWSSMIGQLTARLSAVVPLLLGDTRHPPTTASPRDWATAVALAARLVQQATGLWNRPLRTVRGRALLAGVSAHAGHPLPSLAGAGTGLLLAALAHTPTGWPVPVGGSRAIVDALLDDLQRHGGAVHTGVEVASPRDLPPADVYLHDLTPRAAARILAGRLPRHSAAALERYRYGHGAAKVDFVLDGPVPWRDPDLGRAAALHLGGTRVEIAGAEREVAAERHPRRPVVIASDPAVHDPGRIVQGLRPFWSYAHVPAGSTLDVTAAVTDQIEAHAPGFRDVVVASRCVPAARMAEHDPNYVDGDIAQGALSVRQILGRPTLAADPYRIGPRDFLCSSATPPGPGVHGMCGWFAARRALRVLGLPA